MLHNQTLDFAKRHPYSVTVDFEPDTGWHVARVRIAPVPHFVRLLGALMGDLVHNLRSALDMVAWRLVCLNLGDMPRPEDVKQIHFPRARKPADFWSLKVVSLMGREAAECSEDFQPYPEREHDEFAGMHFVLLLDALWNADKHRRMSVQVSNVNLTGCREFVWDPPASAPTIETLLPSDAYLEDGAQISRVRFEFGNANARVRVKRQPTVEAVTFENEGITLTPQTMIAVCRRTNDVVKASVPLFGRR